MNSRRGVLLSAVVVTMTLSACGSTDSSSEPTSGGESTPSSTTSCPTAAPSSDVASEWEYQGQTGRVAVTGSTEGAAPRIDVTTPFSVATTQVKTLKEGTGPVVGDTSTVSVCYVGVDGRDAKVFDSSYERGAPAEFPLDGVVTGFKKAISGQKVGSTVAVAMSPEDGYPDGMPDAGIQKGDTLVFEIKILSAQAG